MDYQSSKKIPAYLFKCFSKMGACGETIRLKMDVSDDTHDSY